MEASVNDRDPKEDVESGDGAVAEPRDADPPAAEAAAPEKDPLAEAQAEAAKLRDQMLRVAADFDNFRKRSRREIADAEVRGREELLRELLPVFDNLERAMDHAETATSVQSLADGLRMVQRQFADTLGKLDIVRIESTGTPFDPSVHEAIQQIESAEHQPGTVAAEVRSGYRLGERLIRPAMVVVAKAPAAPAPTPESAEVASETDPADRETEG